jgi:NAD(P)H-dependent flavin oxidoreductase YrpB (nitropropane dioxygenase family)
MASDHRRLHASGVPVVASGGIADGRGIAAAFALAAAGTQIGTAYLLCPEAATPQLHRDVLRRARAYATLLTNVFTGRPARGRVNRLALEVGPISDASPDFPLPMGELVPLRAKAEQQGSSDFTPLWSGQAWKGNAGQGADAHIGKGSSRAIQISRRSVKLRPADLATWQHSGLPLLPIACGQREHR